MSKETSFTPCKCLKMYSTPAEYLEALKLKRNEIANGIPFHFDDCDVIGSKHTICSWGLGQGDMQRYGFSSYLAKNQHCPLRTKIEPSGCFWSCRVHKKDGSVRRIKRELVLELFDAAITKAEGRAP